VVGTLPVIVIIERADRLFIEIVFVVRINPGGVVGTFERTVILALLSDRLPGNLIFAKSAPHDWVTFRNGLLQFPLTVCPGNGVSKILRRPMVYIRAIGCQYFSVQRPAPD
jgi:hypothetical protein